MENEGEDYLLRNNLRSNRGRVFMSNGVATANGSPQAVEDEGANINDRHMPAANGSPRVAGTTEASAHYQQDDDIPALRRSTRMKRRTVRYGYDNS